MAVSSEKLMQALQKHKIDPQVAPRLEAVRKFEIVVVCDDSDSMMEPLPTPYTTRWDELKQLTSVVIDLAAALDTNGVDVFFLHRPPLLNLKDTQPIAAAFSAEPSGATPLVPVLQKILDEKRGQSREKKLLILIATDGVPTNQFDDPDPASLADLLRTGRTDGIFVTILACTNNAKDMEYLDGWDRSISNLDVVGDYRAEKAQIEQIYPQNIQFSYGDYIVKTLLGSSDRAYDLLDEGVEIPQTSNPVTIPDPIKKPIDPNLEILKEFDIVLLCDDSGSMTTNIQGTNQTRWDELKSIIVTLGHICAPLDKNGIDVYFLNRPPLINLKDAQKISSALSKPAEGSTPIVPALKKILADKYNLSSQKKLLVIIATDGEPKNEYRESAVHEMEEILWTGRTLSTYVTFVACTDNPDAVHTLSIWDRRIPNLDFVVDFRTEEAKVRKQMGDKTVFTHKDYINKILFGSMDRAWDSLGEVY